MPAFVVKRGLQLELHEGEVMLFVSENISVSLPVVYALLKVPSTRKKNTLMEKESIRHEFTVSQAFVGPRLRRPLQQHPRPL